MYKRQYLHGTDGTITTTTNAAGAVVDVLTNEEAVSGNNVYLTLDIGLQEVAEEALADIIAQLNACLLYTSYHKTMANASGFQAKIQFLSIAYETLCSNTASLCTFLLIIHLYA